MWGRRIGKCIFFKICLSLHDYQSKASRYRKVLTYLKKLQTQSKNIQYIHKNQEEDISIIHEKDIKPQKENQKERDKRNIKSMGKQGLKWQYICINSYLKCLWTKCFSQKTEWLFGQKTNSLQYSAYQRPVLGQRT